MADNWYKKHAVGKVGRKLRGETKSSGGSGGGSSRSQTPFEKLAAERGVDLKAEQERAKSQLESGQRVGGTTESTLARQEEMRGGVSKVDLSSIPIAEDPSRMGLDTTPYQTSRTTPQQTSIIQKIKERILLDFAAMGIVNPPEGLTITGITTIIPSGARGGVGLFGKELPGLARKVGTGIAKNTVVNGLIKTAAAKVSSKVFWKVLGAIGLGAFIAEKILSTTLGGKNIGQFVGQEEAAQGLGVAVNAAYYAGNEEAYNIAKAARDNVLMNNEYWSSLNSLIPYKNFAKGLDDFRKAAIVQAKVMDDLAADKFEAEKSGIPEADQWAAAQEKRSADEKANIDYYNQQRLLTEEAIRKAEKDQRNEDAKFWRKERERLRQQELADAEATANYWLEYQKMKQKLAENNRPSKLNFGIL